MHYNVGSITLRKIMPVTVLLLAKDLLTREAITYMLEGRNYVVVPVGTTKTAYSSFDGIVFDALVVIEALDDPETAFVAFDAKAYQRRIKVILVDGTTPTGTTNYFVDHFIQKPYTLPQLERAVERMTGGPRGKYGQLAY
jgi:DNA-binding response OmpR family regulator